MPVLKIRNPKGLYTNFDEADISLEHLKVAENIRFKEGYIETLFYSLNPYTTGLILSSIEKIIYYDTVNFNNDPYGVDLVDDQLKSNYKYNLVKAEIIVTIIEGVGDNVYAIWIREEGGDWFIPPNILTNASEQELLIDFEKKTNDIRIFNINGIAKILLPHETLWLGKINRNPWGLTGYNGYYLTKLVESYDSDNLGVYYNNNVLETVQGRQMGIIWTSSTQTSTYTENLELKLRFTGAEGIILTDLINGKYRKYRYYDVILLDNPEKTYATIILFSLESTDSSLDNPMFLQFQDETITGLVGQTWTDNLWFFDNIKKNLVVYPSGATLFSAIETDSTSGILSIDIIKDPSIRGFSPAFTEMQLVATAIYDNKDEFVIGYKSTIINETQNFVLQIKNIEIPDNRTQRLTGIAFYLKKDKDEADYEQVKFYNLLSNEEVKIIEGFTIDTLSPNGIFLNQTIGIVYDYSQHKIIDVFDNYQIANGIAYCLKNNTLQYPAIGNGNVSENIFYEQYFIPNVSENEIISLSNLKETLAVHTIAGLKLIIVQDLKIGELFFAIKDTIGYEIINEKAKQETPDGLFILTKQGIFLTTGQDDVSISKPIDDIVELNYDTGGILYNSREKELWFYLSDSDIVFIFNFQYKKWTTVNLNNFSDNPITRIFLNTDFEIIVQSGDDLFKAIKETTGSAKIVTQLSDLGDIKALKAIDAVTVDFEGTLNLAAYDPETNNIRDKYIFNVIIDKRIPANKLSVELNLEDQTKFYGMEIDFEVVNDGL